MPAPLACSSSSAAVGLVALILTALAIKADLWAAALACSSSSSASAVAFDSASAATTAAATALAAASTACSASAAAFFFASAFVMGPSLAAFAFATASVACATAAASRFRISVTATAAGGPPPSDVLRLAACLTCPPFPSPRWTRRFCFAWPASASELCCSLSKLEFCPYEVGLSRWPSSGGPERNLSSTEDFSCSPALKAASALVSATICANFEPTEMFIALAYSSRALSCSSFRRAIVRWALASNGFDDSVSFVAVDASVTEFSGPPMCFCLSSLRRSLNSGPDVVDAPLFP